MSLDNELLRQDQRTANAFTGSSYDDVLDFYEERGANRSNPEDFQTRAIETELEGLTQNEDGTYSNDAGERVYVYHDSAELGDDSNGFKGQNIVMRTEAEIREAWNADEGMGYFKEANPQMDVDTYMEFISEKDSMYSSGVLDLNTHDDLYNTGHKGRGPNADAINAVLAEEKSRVQAAEAEATNALNSKYGVQTSFTNDDGDQFEFNGSTYTKTMKVDDHLGVGDYVKMGAGVLMSVYAAPLLAGSLGAVMGPAAAKAAAAAIVGQANAFMNGQDLSIGDALKSAAMSYGGAKLGDMFSSGGELSGAVSEITDKVTSATDKFNELITTGNSIADAAIKAGGMSMLTSLVTTGEVDIEAAGLAAVMAGGAEGLGKLGNSLTEAGASPEEVDEFMADLSESEEFQQAAMDADIKDPFLNPNYTEVAEGLMTNSAGEIFNYAGDAIGSMSDLDLDGDGMLNGNDLQNITVPDRDVISTLPNDHIDNVYGEGNMDEFPAVPIYSTTVGNFEEEWMDERYAGLSRQQTIDALKASGFDDPSIDSYMEVYDAKSSAIATDQYVTQFGSVDVNMDDPYTIGQTEEGVYYVAQHNGDTGEVTFKSITEGDYNELYDRVYGQSGSAMGTGDWSEVEDYISSNGLANSGDEYSDYNPDGTQVLYNPDGTMVTGSYGSHTTMEHDDWITLNPPRDPNGYVPIDFTDDKTPEPIEPEEVIKEIEEKYTKEESSDPGGENGADNTQPINTSGSNSNDSANSTPDSSSSTSSSADAAALAAAYAAAGKPNPHEGTGGPLDPVANPVETSDLPANTTDDTDDSAIDPTNGLGDPVTPPTNSRIEEMMATGMTYEEAVANQNAAIQAGADADSDGMVTNEEWSLFSGNSATGDSDSTDATDTTDLTGGNGTSEDVTTGTGETDDSTVGSGTEADNTGNTGTGTTGDTGDVSQGTNPDGSVAGPGPNNGPGTDGPGGPGEGLGLGGNGDGGGMMGGDYTPQWGELFAYTTLTPYQKKALAPHADYIKQAKGMLS